MICRHDIGLVLLLRRKILFIMIIRGPFDISGVQGLSTICGFMIVKNSKLL